MTTPKRQTEHKREKFQSSNVIYSRARARWWPGAIAPVPVILEKRTKPSVKMQGLRSIPKILKEKGFVIIFIEKIFPNS